MHRSIAALILTVSCMTMAYSSAHTIEDMKKLIEDKKKSYNKKLRPIYNQNRTILVYTSMEILTIQDFDEVSGKFSAAAFLVLAWTDELVKWDPKQYGGMEAFPAEGGDFWRPPVVLINPFDKVESIGADWNIYRYYANGIVSVAPGDIFEANCGVDVTYYPWDRQTCYFLFNAWGYVAEEVAFVNYTDKVGTSFFSKSGEWDLAGSTAISYSDESGSSVIAFEIRLKRKPRFILVNVILPIIFMSFLNMIVFWIPTESGERISYCLTVLLALAVFLTLVGDNLPKTSNPMSYLSYYLLAILVISVAVVLATVFSLRLYFKDESDPIPACLAAIALCFGCRCGAKGNRSHGHRDYDERRTEQENANNVAHIGLSKLNGRIVRPSSSVYMMAPNDYHNNWKLKSYRDDESYTDVSSKSRNKSSGRRISDPDIDEVQVSWKNVSCAFDMVFFILFFLILVVVTVLFFAIVLNSASD